MNRIYLSELAQDDLQTIKSYIEQDLESPGAALATVRRITKRIRILEEHAYAGARLSSITQIESDYRFLVCGRYLAFYHVNEKDVYIDRILYGSRDYLKVLFGDPKPDDTVES